MKNKTHKLKRERNPMPDFLIEALREADLFDVYNHRPPYQKNDYIGWITRAKREETTQKRLKQMLDELTKGNIYMKMKWNGNTQNFTIRFIIIVIKDLENE